MAEPGPDARGELDALAWLAANSGTPPAGEVWAGDDAAVLVGSERLLLASDALVEDVHFSRRYSSLADVGWKALATNLSDLAAMAGRPIAAVVALIGCRPGELAQVHAGLRAAGLAYGCPVVGGDLSDGPCLVVSVGILGAPAGDAPVLRSGGRPGDAVFVTGPTGAAAAGLRLLAADEGASGPLVEAHRRPRPRLEAGLAASAGGARAMIDVSDGLAIDLHRLAEASGVGFVLDHLAIAPGATRDEALAGGDDYELLFAAPDAAAVRRAFEEAGLAPPVELGRLVEDRSVATLAGSDLKAIGFTHRLG